MPGNAYHGLRLLPRIDQHEGDVQKEMLWQKQHRSVQTFDFGRGKGHMCFWCLQYINHICLYLPEAMLQIKFLQMCCAKSPFRSLPKIFNIFQWPRLRGIWTRNGIHAEMLSVAARSSKMQPWPTSPSVRRQRRGWRSSTRSLSLSPTRSTGCLTRFFEYLFHRNMF